MKQITRSNTPKRTMKMSGGKLAGARLRQWREDMDRQIAACRTVRVILPTLDDLERFWIDHRNEYPYAIEGDGSGCVLAEHEWIFGNTQLAVVRAYHQRQGELIDALMDEDIRDTDRYDRAALDEAIDYWRSESTPLDDALGNVINDEV